MNSSIAIQSGRPSSEINISPEAQHDVHQAYLANMRQRFKSEINRLTRGDMTSMLIASGCSANDTEKLAFLMTYVYAWNWLQQNVHADYQADVLSGFSKGPQAFLMEMLLNSKTTGDFIQSYIAYWQNYNGEPLPQQQHILQLYQQQSSDSALSEFIENRWKALGLFEQSFAMAYKDLAKEENNVMLICSVMRTDNAWHWLIHYQMWNYPPPLAS